MKPQSKIWMDGKLVPWDDAKIHVLTHGLHYGMAIFEGIRAFTTPEGTAIFRLDEHVEPEYGRHLGGRDTAGHFANRDTW